MSALFDLCDWRQWQVAITHIQSLADDDAVDQLFDQNQHGVTALIRACRFDAPLALVQLMITMAKLDSRKRCLLAITGNGGITALHWAAGGHSDPAVLELLIREHPLALSATSISGRTPQQYATDNNRPVAITSLLTDATNVLAAGYFGSLAARVHGYKFALRCLAEPSYAARIAVRTSLLLSIKLGYVYVRRSKRQRNEAPETGFALDTQLAFELLNDNVWSHIMTFL